MDTVRDSTIATDVQSGPPSDSSSLQVQEFKTTHTIHISHLDYDVPEDIIFNIVQRFGIPERCKIFRQSSDGRNSFALVEYSTTQACDIAIGKMNGWTFMNRRLKVDYFTPSKYNGYSRNTRNPDGFTIYVGDLNDNVSEKDLVDGFEKFGKIIGVRVRRNWVTNQSKRYGFITFDEHGAAGNAINEMNNAWFKTRFIRVSWATFSKNSNAPGYMNNSGETRSSNGRSFAEVANQTHYSVKTIYVGNMDNISDALLKKEFGRFGDIVKTTSFPTRRYGFVQFGERNSAVTAILKKDRTVVNGSMINVWWGRELNVDSLTPDTPFWDENQMQRQFYMNSGYGYSGGTSYSNHPAVPSPSNSSGGGGGMGLARSSGLHPRDDRNGSGHHQRYSSGEQTTPSNSYQHYQGAPLHYWPGYGYALNYPPPPPTLGNSSTGSMSYSMASWTYGQPQTSQTTQSQTGYF